jgi:hypothetical protein
MNWLIFAFIAVGGAGGLIYALRRFVYDKIAEQGADAERVRQKDKELQTARDLAKDAAQAAETRHEIDRSDFNDAVDRL